MVCKHGEINNKACNEGMGGDMRAMATPLF